MASRAALPQKVGCLELILLFLLLRNILMHVHMDICGCISTLSCGVTSWFVPVFVCVLVLCLCLWVSLTVSVQTRGGMASQKGTVPKPGETAWTDGEETCGDVWRRSMEQVGPW